MKRRIVIYIFLIWTLIKWSEQYILYARTIFYISRAIKKSSKQWHIIVCFNVLSISSAFTIWTYFINEWIPRRNFKKRTISDTSINNGSKKKVSTYICVDLGINRYYICTEHYNIKIYPRGFYWHLRGLPVT